jgi:uncharacterized protein (DUF302 family)
MLRLNPTGSQFHRGGDPEAGHVRLRWALIGLLALVAAALLLATAAAAQDVKRYAKKAAFDDVKFDLTNAITNRGLVVDSNGNVGGMLERTGKDVGSTKQIYKQAEYFVFCSARLSREMMETDAANAAFCPFVIFIYEAAAKPGETVVGYRALPAVGNAASKKALTAVNALLDGIAKEAVK